MSDDESRSRSTVKIRRRSLRISVDEVPRRSSPSMPRISLVGSSALAPLPPLEPTRTDPGILLADSDIEVEESREMDVVPVEVPISTSDEIAVSTEIERTTAPEPAAPLEPTLAELGLDAEAVARAAAPAPEPELAPEATVVTDPVRRSVEPEARIASAPPPPDPSELRSPRPSERPPPPARLSDRPARVPLPSDIPPPSDEAPPPSRPSVRPSNPPAGVVIARVSLVGTPTPSVPLRVSEEIAKVVGEIEATRKAESAKEEAAKETEIDLEVEEARTSAPPDEPAAEEIAPDEFVEEKTPKPQQHMPSRPPPRRSPSLTGTPAVSAPPPPPPAAHAVSAPPAPPPREVSAPPNAPPPPPPQVSHPPAPPPAPPVRDRDAPSAPPAPPAPAAAPTDGPGTDPRRPGKKKGAWWEDFFNDDYLRTVPAPMPKTVRRQCDFIEQRLGLAAGATILDVGCGLGLHACELTRRGYIVVGLDLSLPMLSRAADEAQDQGFKINFLHADMREMSFDSAFDAVLSWGTTFGYFDDDVNRAVLERMHKALKPGGLLLLDVVNRDYVIRSQPNNVWFEGDGCVVMEETQCNYITSRLHVKRTVMLDDGRQRESAYSVRLYSLHELGQMLHKSFRVVEVTGRESTPGVYFGADSPRTIIVAERRVPEKPPGPPAPPTKRDPDQTPPPAAPPASDAS
jgi:SAM-dependent methyltransferase